MVRAVAAEISEMLPKCGLTGHNSSRLEPKLPSVRPSNPLIGLGGMVEAGGIEHSAFHVKQRLRSHAALMLPLELVIFSPACGFMSGMYLP